MGLECSAVAMEHDLCTNIRVIDVCTEFDMFEVKVPIIFFSAQWVFRHAKMDVSGRGKYSEPGFIQYS